MLALSRGCTFSASTAASAKNGRNESLTPSRASKSALARSRSRAIAVTSTSTTVVSWAEVCSDSTIRRAISCRARDIRSVLPRRLRRLDRGPGRAAPGPGCAGAGAAWRRPRPGRRPRRTAARAAMAVTPDPGRIEHVLLADPAADPGPGDGGEVHAVLGGQLADQRGDVRAVGAVPSGGAGRAGPSSRPARRWLPARGLRRRPGRLAGAGAGGAGGAGAGASGAGWRRRGGRVRLDRRARPRRGRRPVAPRRGRGGPGRRGGAGGGCSARSGSAAAGDPVAGGLVGGPLPVRGGLPGRRSACWLLAARYGCPAWRAAGLIAGRARLAAWAVAAGSVRAWPVAAAWAVRRAAAGAAGPAAGVRGGAGGRRAVLVDHRELGADRDRLVLGDGDAAQDPGHRRGDLGVDLVGGDLEQRLVRLHPLALLLQPAGDGALGDALAELGHGYGDRHGFP